MPKSFPREILPNFNAINPTKIEPMIREILADNKTKINELISQAGPFTWDNLMQPLEEMGDQLSNLWSPISHLHAVLETASLRSAYNAVLPLLTEYHTAIAQNEKLYQAIVSIAERPDFHSLSAAQQKIIQNDLRDFKLSGIHLSRNQKERLAVLEKELSRLTTTFSENLLDATNDFFLSVEDAESIAGLPPQARQLAIDNATARGLKGYVFTLEYPSYSTAIKFLHNREFRERLYKAYVTRASDASPNAPKWDNTTIMEDILKVRHEIAAIVGFNNFAEYSLAKKMAKSPDEVLHFLHDLVTRSKTIAEQEYQAIQAIAKEIDGLEILEAWDIPYYSEKLRQSTFDFSAEDLRPYFPIDHVLSGMFTILNQLYGIKIVKQTDVDVWHPDVEFFAIYDHEDCLRGGFYTDLYARPHKKEGAWMDECRNKKRTKNNEILPGIAFLTCNFMPPTDAHVALLTHDDVITLFHEFGHCLHHLLTQVHYPSVGGINGVPWDAVEFPSQFMEFFCWEKASLNLIAAHYQTGKALPDDLYDKMIAAKHFQTGLQMIRQLEFALFDFLIHLNFDAKQQQQVQTVLNAVRAEVSVLPVPSFNRFQHTFSHIFAGGYAAGYYSYKWAEVLSADAYEKFEENGIFDRATGRSFMENILEVGGVRDPMASFIAFRGRKPKIDALLRHSGIQ